MIHGKTENKESWEECKEKVAVLIKNVLQIKNNIVIERGHRVGPKQEGRPRTIV